LSKTIKTHTYLYDINISLETSLKTEQLLFEQFFYQIAIKLLTAKINNKINITAIKLPSYRHQLLIPYDTHKLTKGLYNSIKHFYKYFLNKLLTIPFLHLVEYSRQNTNKTTFVTTISLLLLFKLSHKKISKQKNNPV